MKEILRFKYKNTELCLFENEGNLLYVKVINGEFIFELTLEEKEIINKVLAKLTPSRNIYDFGFIKYNQKRFRHFYDMDRNFHLFYEGDDLRIPDPKDTYLLNKLFNNQEEYFAYRKSDHNNFYNPHKGIKRIILIGASLLIISLSVEGISYLIEKGEPIVKPHVLYGKYEESSMQNAPINASFPDYNEADFEATDMAQIMLAIDSNQHLTIQEKNLIKSTISYYGQSLPYIDASVLSSLRRFKIEYIPDSSLNGLLGQASKTFGSITIYNATSFDDAAPEVFKEEVAHLLNREEIPDTGSTFYEFLTKVNIYEHDIANGITRKEIDFNYTNTYCRILANLLNQETLNKFLVNSNPYIIISALNELIPDTSLAMNLLMNIDACNNLTMSFAKGETKEEGAETFSYLKKSIEATLKVYYKQKYESKEEDNLQVLLLLDRDLAVDKIGEELGIDKKTIEMIKAIPDSLNIYRHAGIFMKDQEMTISLPIYLRKSEKIYSMAELLTGIDGLKYETMSDVMNDPSITQVDVNKFSYLTMEESYILYNVPKTISKTKNKG